MDSIIRFDDVILSGGTGRSGTTIVGKLLARHSTIGLSKPAEIKILTGGNGLLDIHSGRKVGKYRKFLLTDWLHLQRFQYRLWHDWWNRPDKLGGTGGLIRGVTEDQLKDIEIQTEKIWREDKTHAMRYFLRTLIDLHKAASGKAMWIDTTPTNMFRADEISEFLPGVRFINMVRDGRDAIASVVREDWGPSNYDDALIWWRRRMIRIAKNCNLLKNSVITMSIENLVIENRELEYRRLLQFTSVENEANIQEYFNHEVMPSRVRQGRWRSDVANPEEFNSRYLAVVQELKSINASVPLSDL